MATVERDDGEALTRAERVAILVAVGISEAYARLVVAQEDGEPIGDVVVVDEAGKVVGRPASPSLVDSP